MKIGSVACALAAACFFAAPAWSGVSPPPSQASPAALARVPSGEIESGQVASAQAARLLHIAPRGSRPFGRSYREWVARWTEWAVETKRSVHPLLDEGDCSVNQKGRVWFLGGSFFQGTSIVRNCTVPEGTALFVALTSGFWLSTPEVAPCIGADVWYKARPGNDAYDDFKDAILDPIKYPDVTRLSLKLNGAPAAGLRSLFFRSAVFTARLPDDNIFDAIFEALGICPGEDIPAILTRPDVAWGFHVFLQPLPPGSYTLHFKANVDHIDFNEDPFPIRQDVIYNLTVRPDLN